MKLSRTFFPLLTIASTLLLANCGSVPTYHSPSLSVSPAPSTLAVGSSVTFTATTAATGPVSWSLTTPSYVAFGDPVSGPQYGTLSSSTGATVTYTAPATPPIYSDPIVLAFQQGNIVIQAIATPTDIPGGIVASFTPITITAPTVTTGLSPLTASVALGATQLFNGYAVGNINNGLTWQVNGVTGGSTAYGSIAGGFYTAPANMPMTGPTVTITMISQADPTKTATAVVTLH